MFSNNFSKPIPYFETNDIEVFYDKKHQLVLEPLVDITEYNINGENYYARIDGLNYPYCCQLSDFNKLFCRKSVAQKLALINAKIAEFDLELYVLDAFRPLKTQEKLWEYFLKQALKTTNSQQDATKEALKYCSNPLIFSQENPSSHPVHSTGGAIDLTLRRISNNEHLFMGSLFDEALNISSPFWFEKQSQIKELTVSEKAALYNRRLLHNIMVAEGFAPHPNEWWHFDYGTKLWAASFFNSSDNKSFFYCYIDA